MGMDSALNHEQVARLLLARGGLKGAEREENVWGIFLAMSQPGGGATTKIWYRRTEQSAATSRTPIKDRISKYGLSLGIR
jgi:hypothetical protein